MILHGFPLPFASLCNTLSTLAVLMVWLITEFVCFFFTFLLYLWAIGLVRTGVSRE